MESDLRNIKKVASNMTWWLIGYGSEKKKIKGDVNSLGSGHYMESIAIPCGWNAEDKFRDRERCIYFGYIEFEIPVRSLGRDIQKVILILQNLFM